MCVYFSGVKMYRQAVQLGCDSPAPAGDRGGPHCECVAQGAGGGGAGGALACVQVEADGGC